MRGEVSEVSLSLSFSLSLSLQHQMDIVFSTWDLAGQEVYYATHQCFLSRNTLYLVVWSMEEGDKGIEYLRPWLLNIQVTREVKTLSKVKSYQSFTFIFPYCRSDSGMECRPGLPILRC